MIIISLENKVLETYRFTIHAKVQKLDSDRLYDADTEDVVKGGVLKQKLISNGNRNNTFSKWNSKKEHSQFKRLKLNKSCVSGS